MTVLPALWPLSVAFTEVCPAGITTDVVLQKAVVSATPRLTVTGDAFGLLSRIGTDSCNPRPMLIVSRLNDRIAGPLLFTVTTAAFDVIEPLCAVTFVVPFATPVTRPVEEFTVAMDGPDD